MPKNRILAIILIVIGGLIFSCLIAFLILQDYTLLAGLLLGSLLIMSGVAGIMFMRGDRGQLPTGADSRPPRPATSRARASQSASKASPSVPSSEKKLKRMNKAPRVRQANLELVLGAVGGGMFLFMALLLACNLSVELLPLLNTRETQVVACEDVASYAEKGWHVISTYTYPLTDAGKTSPDLPMYYACMIERETWFWAKRTPESDVFTPTLSAEFTTTLEALTMPTLTVSADVSLTPQTPTPQPSPRPTQTPLPSPTFTPKPTATLTPRPTPTALPSPTPRATATPMTTASSPLSTPTLPGATVPTATVTPLPLSQTLGPVQNTAYDVTYTLQITITDVQLLEPQALEDPLPPGFTYAIVYITIKNLGPGPMYDLNSEDFHIREVEDVSREPVMLPNMKECTLDIGDLFPTEAITTCLAFEVRMSGPLDVLYAPGQLDTLEDERHLRFTLRP